MNFYDRLDKCRKEKGVTSKFLCDAVNRPRYYITNCKNKNISIPLDTIATWADILDTTAEYLLGKTDDPEQKKDAPIQMDERKLKILEKYDQLSDENKAVVDAFIEGILLSRG